MQDRSPSWFKWDQTKKLLVVSILQAIGYVLIAKAISLVLSEEVGHQVGVFLAANALLSLLVYPLSTLVNSSRRLLLWMLPASMSILLLMSQKVEWLPILWVVFGPITAAIYASADGLFQQSLPSTEQKSKEASVQKTFKISSCISQLATALAGALGVWIASEYRTIWIPLAITFMACAMLILWRTPVAESRRSNDKSLKETLRLCLISFPYLGATAANAAVSVSVPIFLDAFVAGMVLFVMSSANAFGYLVPFKGRRTPYLLLFVGILLFPLSATWLSGMSGVVLYLLAGLVVGVASSQCKLQMRLTLFQETATKTRAAASLHMMSDAGYIVGPLLMWLAAFGDATIVWIAAAILPLIAVVIRR